MAWKKVYVKGKGYRYTDGNGNYRLTNPASKETLRKAATALYNVPQQAADTLNRLGIGVNKNRKPKPKPTNSKIDSSKYDIDSQPPKGPNQVKPAKPAETKPKPQPQPAAAKPKPKPKQETVNGKTVKRVGPVNTPADKPKMNKLKIDKAMASTRKAYLKNLQEEEKKKSIAKGKANRSRRNTTARGPRDRY